MPMFEISVDPSVMRLPHPVRLDAATEDFFFLQKRVFREEWPVIEACLRDEKALLPQACRNMTEGRSMPILMSTVGMTALMPGNTEHGGIFSTLAWLRHKVLPYTHVKFDDDLALLLENTDYAGDVPLQYLVPPYPRCYLEFGGRRDLKTQIMNEVSGLHVLEGAYVEHGEMDGHECLYIVLTGSPLGHENATDDATLCIHLVFDDRSRSIDEAVRSAFENQLRRAHELKLKPSSRQTLPTTIEAVKLVAKALLYLGLSGIRKELREDATALRKTAAGLKSGAKRAKLARKMTKAYDHILVHAPQLREYSSHQNEPGERHAPSVHWRRAHFKMQPHGPRHSLRKLVLINTTLVGTLREGEEAPKPKKYTVR